MQKGFTFSLLSLSILLLLLSSTVTVAQTATKSTDNTKKETVTAKETTPATSSGPKYTLKSSRKAGCVDKVAYSQAITGYLIGVSEKDPSKTEKYPVSASTQMVYSEKTVKTGQENGTFAINAIRNYTKINTKRTVNKDTITLTLPKDKSLLNVTVNGSYCAFFHSEYCMTREDLDILEVLGSSLVLEALLPSEPVAVNDEWIITEEALAALLQFQALSQAQVVQCLTSVTDSVATIEAGGKAVGISDGAPTEIDFNLTYKFDLKLNRITFADLQTTEKCPEGPITPPLSMKSHLQMKITPTTESSDAVLANAKWTEPSHELLLLHYESADGSWSMYHDRNWHLVQNEVTHTIFRFISNGEHIAQCDISKPTDVTQLQNMTLDQFKQEVESALKEDEANPQEETKADGKSGTKKESGTSTRSIVNSVEDVSQITKNKIYQVIANDSKDSSTWAYYMIKGKPNQNVIFIYTLDGSRAENIGESDGEMVGSLQFNTVTQPTGETTPSSTIKQ